MSADILTTDVLQARLNLMPQIHDELEAQIKEQLQGQNRKDIAHIKEATIVLIKLHITKMIKNQARYGETSTNDDHLHFIEGRHAYQLFYALDSSMHVEELELSEDLLAKYDADIERLLNVRGQLTPFINVAIETFDSFSEDLDLTIEYHFKTYPDILTMVQDKEFRLHKFDSLIEEAFKQLATTHQYGDFGTAMAQASIVDTP